MVKNDCGIMVEVKKYKKGVEGSKLSRSRKDVNTARKVSDHRALFRRLTLAGKPKMPGPGRACFNDNEKFTIGSCCTSHLLSEAWFIKPLCTMQEHQERAPRNGTTESWYVRPPRWRPWTLTSACYLAGIPL